MDAMRKIRPVTAVIFALLCATAVVFGRAAGYGFISYDDAEYVTANPLVKDGLTRQALVRAFTTSHFANWHALTWLSHMIDVELWGMNPKGHHVSSILLHMANLILLFGILLRLSGSIERSGFITALFALHPAHVEPVVWIASRKDVLSTLFAFLCLWTYISYVGQPGIGRYSLVVLFFLLGLLSKPMIVTLPFLLLLIDYWPLGRTGKRPLSPVFPTPQSQRRTLLELVTEKIPLIVVSLAACVLTYLIQERDQALRSFETVPVGIRMANAVVAYVSYLGKMFWPTKLAVFYPHPMGSLPEWKVVGAALVLVGISVAALRMAKIKPYILVGWLWYIIVLVPVIGIIQFGSHSMADRYTYLSFIGLFLIITWGIPELALGKMPDGRTCGHGRILPVCSCIALLALAVTAWVQVGFWQSNYNLFRHTLAVTRDNVTAHCSLADELRLRGRIPLAIRHYRRALEINPRDTITLNNLGVVMGEMGNQREALKLFERALEIDPSDAEAHSNAGVALASEGRLSEAIEHYLKALQVRPDHSRAHYNLGLALIAQGKLDSGIQHLKRAAELDPGNPRIRYDLAFAHVRKGDLDSAIREFRASIQLNPRNASSFYNLGVALAARSNYREAVTAYRKAILLDPQNPSSHKNLAVALFELGEYTEAWKEAEICRKLGGNPHPKFLRMLRERMQH